LSSPPWLFFSGLVSFSPHHFGTYSLLGSRQLLLLNFLHSGSGTPQELVPPPPPRLAERALKAFTPLRPLRGEEPLGGDGEGISSFLKGFEFLLTF